MQYQLGDGLNRHPPSWQQQGAAHGYNPNKRGRLSHHPLLAFVAEARRVANFWLRPGGVHSANNVLPLIESTLLRLGSKSGGLLRAESGCYDKRYSSHSGIVTRNGINRCLPFHDDEELGLRDYVWANAGHPPVLPVQAKIG